MHSPQPRDHDDAPEGSHLLKDFDKEAETTVDVTRRQTIRPRIGSRISTILRNTNYTQHCKDLLFFLLPSFIQTRIHPVAKTKKLHPTAFLDGMRGIAALCVAFYHVLQCSYDIYAGYASGKKGEHREILRLPFIRIIYSGPTMVAIFFVVSGYALSYKPVRLMSNKKWKDLALASSSSIFRRGIRLFLPCMASTLLISLFIRVHAYDWGREYLEAHHHLNRHHKSYVKRFDTLFEQLVYWVQQFWPLINPWNFETKISASHIDGHLWTIPLEFRSSLILYVTHLGVACLKPMLRIGALVALIIWCHYRDRWEMILFFGGFLLAELDYQRSASRGTALPTSNTASPDPALSASRTARNEPFWSSPIKMLRLHSRHYWNAFYTVVFILGFYFGCQPIGAADKTPGWRTLYSWIPSFVHFKQRFWPNYGALMMVYATSNLRLLQRFFTCGLVQYLGRISFSVYVLHGLVSKSVGYGLMNVVWGSYRGKQTEFQKGLGFSVGGLATLFVTIWAADIFTRAVDEPSVKFAKWFEKKCTVTVE